MKIKIVKDTNPKIRLKSVEVPLPLSKEDQDIIDSMFDYLVKSQDEEYAQKHNIRAGVGLAAIQCGFNKRMFVIYYQNARGEQVQYKLVNPKIKEHSMRKVAIESGEGCLSVDNDHKGLVHRYFKIKMEAFDAITNKDVVITASGYDAVVLQHEFDHLNGVLYYDHIVYDAPFTQLPDEELI